MTATPTTETVNLTGDYTLDPAHSRIGFVARHAMVTKVRGLFKEFDGAIHLDGEDPTRSSARVSIEVASIDSQQADRDAHLRGADFFDAERFPTMTFASTRVDPAADGRYTLTGDLTIRDITRPVSIDLELTGVVRDPWGMHRIGFEGSVAVNRRDWDLSWNMPLDTGGLLVSEKVTIELDVALVRPAQG
jgi:polyisoprenoid-binding protein YceI